MLQGSIKKRIFCNFNGCGNKRSSRDFTSADIALDDDSDTLRQDGGMNLPYDSLISSQSDLQNPFLRQQMAERLQEAADNYRNEAEPASAWNALNLRRLARLSAMRAMGEAPRRINKRSVSRQWYINLHADLARHATAYPYYPPIFKYYEQLSFERLNNHNP